MMAEALYRGAGWSGWKLPERFQSGKAAVTAKPVNMSHMQQGIGLSAVILCVLVSVTWGRFVPMATSTGITLTRQTL